LQLLANKVIYLTFADMLNLIVTKFQGLSLTIVNLAI